MSAYSRASIVRCGAGKGLDFVRRQHPAVLPSALVIGPMKCGTSWIQKYLESRGDICLPEAVKETFFFDRYYHKGMDWYAGHFQGYNGRIHDCIVEVAPSLFHAPDSPQRVRAILGEIPLIVTIRDPLKRAWSHYQHLRRKGYTRATLQDATRKFPEIINASRYDFHVKRWSETIPKASLTVLSLEDLGHSPDKYVESLCSALKIKYKPAPISLSSPVGAAGVPPSLSLAWIGRITARAFRSIGAYGIVNLAKKAGLKKVFFGGAAEPTARPVPSEDELRFIEMNLKDEVADA